MKMRQVLAALVAVCAFGGFADSIYVAIDDPHASDEACEGRGSEALPYWSISAAVKAAEKEGSGYDFAAGDKILVKPGVYSNDTPYYVSQKYRYTQIYITKPLWLESTGGRDVTAIEGLFSKSWREGQSGATRWGEGSSRCVLVTADAAGTVIRGFTLRNGATRQEDYNTAQGGGVLALANAYVVDSAITNCATQVSGASLEGGTAIRTIIGYNYLTSWPGGSIVNAKLWNCLIRETHISTSSRTLIGVTTVNCTFAMGSVCFHTTTNYNALIEYNAYSSDSATVLHDHSYVTSSLTTGTWDPQTYSPAFLDARLLTISDAIGIGDTSLIRSVIDIPDEFAATDFYGNAIDYSSETCNAGACQQTVTPPCGALKMGSGALSAVDGTSLPNGCYIYPKASNHVFRIAQLSGTPCYATFSATGVSGSISDIPYYTNTYLAAVPPQPERTVSLWIANANDVVWADANSTEATEDGTEEYPYKTLQSAIDATKAVASGSKYSVIFVKPGEYATGGTATSDGILNRVYFKNPGGSHLIIRSTGGAAVTTIRGGTDVRGVYGGCTLKGFTIADCSRTASDDNGVAAQSAGLVDCVVTNCSGTYVARSTSLLRCRVVDSTATMSLCRGSSVAFCDFYGNTVARLVHGDGETAQFCSIAGNTVTGTLCGNPVYTRRSNIDAEGYQFGTRSDDVDTVLWNYTYWSHPDNYTYADPRFVDKANGDLRLTTASPGFGLAKTGCGATENWFFYLTVDIDGVVATEWPDVLSTGPHQGQVLTMFTVNDPSGSLALTGATVGDNLVPYGTVRTVTAQPKADAPRQVLALVRTYADGSAVTNRVADLPGGVLTFEVSTHETAVTLDTIEGTHFYLDAVNGDDTKSAFTSATAMKTFMALYDRGSLVAGDTVHLLPGVYDEGYGMLQDLGLSYVRDTRTRMIVPAGVTVLAENGPGTVIVKGAPAPFEPASDGCGSNATRCVYLGAGARLEGLTLTGGATSKAWGDGSLSGDYGGAAVYASDRSARVVDCVVTNCYGGDMLQNCTVVRLFLDKCGRSGGGLVGGCKVYSSYLRGINVSKGSVNGWLYNSHLLVDTGTAMDSSGSIFVGAAYNSVIYGHTASGCSYYNCVLPTNATYNAWSGSAQLDPVNCHDCVITTTVAVAADKWGRAQTKDNPFFVNTGDNAYLADDEDMKYDLDGHPRTMDYAVDIGAYEWDIRPEVKAAFGRRVASVGWISSNAVAQAGQVLLDGDGATLEATLVSREGTGTLAVPATLTGEGTLTCTVDGVEEGALTATGTLAIPDVAYGSTVVFAYTGSGTAALGTLALRRGFMLILK